MQPVLDMRAVRFGYGASAPVLEGFELRVEPGEKLLVAGASGAGKSTLLGLVSGTLLTDHGSIEVMGRDLATLRAGARDRFRARAMGVIFQLFNLVPYLGVVENVLLPMRLTRTKVEDATGRARRLLARLGLDESLVDRPVAQLSVGQQQRVAAARAFILEPGLVLADEPTSALDPDRRDDFMSLMLEEAERTGAAVVCVSHDESLHPHFDRVVRL